LFSPIDSFLQEILAPAKTQPKADQPSSWLSQGAKKKYLLVSPNLAYFASLREIDLIQSLFTHRAKTPRPQRKILFTVSPGAGVLAF
jgi:hypothetical protein